MAPIQPIGTCQPGAIAVLYQLPYATLTSAVVAWRRRACAIALGNCRNDAFVLDLSMHSDICSARRLVSYADHIELQSLRSAARLADARISDAGAPRRAHPTRLWPGDYPVIEPVIDDSDRAAQTSSARLGDYIDIVL